MVLPIRRCPLHELIEKRFREIAPRAQFCSLRLIDERSELLAFRQNIPQPVTTQRDFGVMITVIGGGGMGYAATSDLSLTGLRRAAEVAHAWARSSAGHSVVDWSRIPLKPQRGEYATRVEIPWQKVPLAEKLDLLREECGRLKIDEKIIDWGVSLLHVDLDNVQITTDGGHVVQRLSYMIPLMSATASRGTEAQTRTLGGRGCCRQGGMEVLDHIGFRRGAPQIADDALQLLDAPNCPTGKMDLVLGPDQMILQVHESIGHPLELDRILGDERNCAGTSFVTPEMIGSYRYGSELLNVTFDPTRPEQFATYAFDDDGQKATREYLIKDGILLRALGGTISQARSGLPGVANSRASSWNRPPIDRMANLNLEPGDASLEEMIAAVEDGVYMRANRSWSIDDSRNKFQFGCEWGQRIEKGRLTTVVKNPNYRGISATFWRSLKRVGNRDTLEVLGTPNCGKGEPGQVARVGHAAPACLITGVDVFGGV